MTKTQVIEYALNELNQVSGKLLWGVSLSIAGISLEIGETRRYSDDKKNRGELSVYSDAHWTISKMNDVLFSKEDCIEQKKTAEVHRAVSEMFKNGRLIKSIHLDKSTNTFRIEIEGDFGIKLETREKDFCWTLFFQYQTPNVQEWCSFYSNEIRVND